MNPEIDECVSLRKNVPDSSGVGLDVGDIKPGRHQPKLTHCPPGNADYFATGLPQTAACKRLNPNSLDRSLEEFVDIPGKVSRYRTLFCPIGRT